MSREEDTDELTWVQNEFESAKICTPVKKRGSSTVFASRPNREAGEWLAIPPLFIVLGWVADGATVRRNEVYPEIFARQPAA